jgi:hypothetical protein
MNNGKQPINPSMWTKYREGSDDYKPLKDGQKTGWETKFGGLTKREYFAGKALQGLLSLYDSDGGNIVPTSENVVYMAKLAVTAADALLSELSNEDGQ